MRNSFLLLWTWGRKIASIEEIPGAFETWARQGLGGCVVFSRPSELTIFKMGIHGFVPCSDDAVAIIEVTGKHNEGRMGVVDHQHAMFRCSQAIVHRIDGPCGEALAAADGHLQDVLFEVGTTLHMIFDGSHSFVGNGLRYFPTYAAAKHYNSEVPGQYTGTWTIYSHNGALREVCSYKEGLRHGPRKKYNTSGILLRVETWHEGVQQAPTLEYEYVGPSSVPVGVREGVTRSKSMLDRALERVGFPECHKSPESICH